MRRARFVAAGAAVMLVVLPLDESWAGSHRTRGGGGAPVGEHSEGSKVGSEGNVTAIARSYVTWADNFTSVTLEDGVGEGRYCAPGDCISDGRSTVPAEELTIQSQFVVWGKEVSVTDSGSASVSRGGPSITAGRSKTTNEKMVTVTFTYDVGKAGEGSHSMSGIRVDGKRISRADHVVRVTATRNGKRGTAEGRTTTYLR